MKTQTIPFLFQQIAPVQVLKHFVIEQIDTTKPKCHNTEKLVVKKITQVEGKEAHEEVLFTFESWMSTCKLDKRNEMDHIYYSEDEHKVDCLQKMIESINDSFDQSPPNSKARAKLKALADAIMIFKKNA